MTESDLESEKIRLFSACDTNLRAFQPPEQDFWKRISTYALSTLLTALIALLPALICYFFIDKTWSVYVFCAFVVYLGLLEVHDCITTSIWSNSTNTANRISALAFCTTNLANQVEALRKSPKS